jgi:hypothetical protein
MDKKKVEKQTTSTSSVDEEFRRSHYKSNAFGKSLEKQVYNDIIKQKDKWQDDLFPPNEISLYSGSTEFSNYTGPNRVPLFLNVKYSKFMFYLNRKLGKRNLFLK